MQLFATFVKNRSNYFNFLVQQKLALLIAISVLMIYTRDHQTFFAKGRITARLAAAGRMRIENRYRIFRISTDSI